MTAKYTAPPVMPSPSSIVVNAISNVDGSVIGTSTITIANPAINVSLEANPNPASQGEQVMLTATTTGVSGLINYYFWWNCPNPTTDLNTAESSCGAAKYLSTTNATSVQTSFSPTGNVMPKVIIAPADSATWSPVQNQVPMVVDAGSITVACNPQTITSPMSTSNCVATVTGEGPSPTVTWRLLGGGGSITGTTPTGATYVAPFGSTLAVIQAISVNDPNVVSQPYPIVFTTDVSHITLRISPTPPIRVDTTVRIGASGGDECYVTWTYAGMNTAQPPTPGACNGALIGSYPKPGVYTVSVTDNSTPAAVSSTITIIVSGPSIQEGVP
jgi:hypothetical protein